MGELRLFTVLSAISEANKKKNIDSLVPDLEEMSFEGPNLLPLEEDLEEEAVSAL